MWNFERVKSCVAVRRILLAVTMFASAHSAAIAAESVFKSAQPAPRVEHWQQRLIAIDQETKSGRGMSAVRIVFLGDSITDFWLLPESPWQKNLRYGRTIWDESFGTAAGANRSLNMGISGDRIEHVLYRIHPRRAGGLGQLDAPELDPDFVVLLIGINNTWMSEDPVVDSIVEGVRAVLTTVHARKPRARIVLQTLLPTGEFDRNQHIVQPVNRRLAALAGSSAFSNYVALFDLHAAFLDRDGRQISNLFIDGLHPNEAGYRVWRDKLLPFLEQERQKAK